MPILPASLSRQLVALRAWFLALRAARWLVLWVAGWCVAMGATVVAFGAPEQAPDAPQWLLPTIFLTGAASLAAALLGALAWPVSARCLGRLVEARFPDLQDRLLTVLVPAAATDPEAPLSRALAMQVSERLRRERLVTALDLVSLRRLALAAIPCVLTAALCVAAFPDGLARLKGLPDPLRSPLAKASEVPAGPPEARSPVLLDLSVSVQPPEYTGLPARTLTDEFETITVPEGSRVRVQARAGDDARCAFTLGDSPENLGADAEGLVAREFSVTRDLSWRLEGSRGSERVSYGPCKIRMTADKAPRVRITEPGKNLKLTEAGRIALSVEARDDYGLAAVSLLYRRIGASPWQSAPLGSGGRQLATSQEWDLAPMALRPGEGVEYRALARDNNNVTGPRSRVTKTYAIMVAPRPEPEPTPEAVEQTQDREQDALTKLREQAAGFRQQIDEMLQQAQSAGAEGQTPQISRAALQETMARLKAGADDVRQAMAQAEKALADNPLLTDDLVQKVRDLHELMAEVMNEDLKNLMEKIQTAMSKLGTREFRMSLEQAREAQQKFMERLDQTIEMLRKAKLEAQLEALRHYVEQLADRQEDLLKRTDDLADGEKASVEARNQRDLSEKADPLAEQVRKLSEEMMAENEQIAADLRALAGDLNEQDPGRSMRDAAASLQEGRPSSAHRPQSQALQSLRDAAAALAGAAADLTEDDRKSLTDAARRFVRDAITLSRDQEATIGDERSLAAEGRVDVVTQKDRLTRIARRQEAVQTGAEGLAARMVELSRTTSVVPPKMPARAARLAAQMAQARNEIEAGEIPRAALRQTRTMQGLNELARDLLDMSKQLNKTSAQMALQQYMKRLEQLAQEQKGLNQKTQGMGQPQEQGGGRPQPGGTQPMPGPGDLAQLAMEQALIRAALQKLLSGQGSSSLVDQLGGAPEQMQEVEEDLKSGTVKRETVKRQQEILHKMLDAQRSLYSKQKESKERKAEKPTQYVKPPSPPTLRPRDQAPLKRDRERSSMGRGRLPLDFESETREYLNKVRR